MKRGQFISLDGQEFAEGRVRVLRTFRRFNYTLAECECKCGTTFTCHAKSLKAGTTNSCGCYWRERLKNRRTSNQFLKRRAA